MLFQVVFLALLLEERGAGDLTQVAEGITAKLIRRHPHVFGEASGARAVGAMGSDPRTAGEVRGNWDRIKREVEGPGDSGDDPFAGIPETFPALLYAAKVLRRADPDGVAPAPRGAARDAAEERVGELLLAAVGVARSLGVDPELALRAAADRFRDRAAPPRSEADRPG